MKMKMQTNNDEKEDAPRIQGAAPRIGMQVIVMAVPKLLQLKLYFSIGTFLKQEIIKLLSQLP